MFFVTACCPTINVLLENDVKDKWSSLEGVYTFHGYSNEVEYWVDAGGQNAIWYYPNFKDWAIGLLYYLGTYYRSISSDNDLETVQCPNNEGYLLIWKYSSYNSWTATNDVDIKCANENDFCTSQNPCVTNQGDCDIHDECQDGLSCGSNNCPDFLGFHSEFDCCYAPTIGDEHFCASGIPCGEDEGDCDFHNECQNGLACGSNNCPASLGFDSEVDCCYKEDCFEQGIAYCCDYEITNLATETVSLCQIECQNNNLCSHWSYISKFCYLKSAKGNSFSYDSATSGPKFCSEKFCTSEIPCDEDEGDCDSHNECQEDLFCGSNNCLASLNFDSEVDCCVNCTTTAINFRAKIK